MRVVIATIFILVLGLFSSAQAACSGALLGNQTVQVGATLQVSIRDPVTCNVISTSRMTVSGGSAIATVVPNSAGTGYVITGVQGSPSGTTVTFTPTSGYNPVALNFSVPLATPIITSP